jgi:hypothetical protein
MTLANMRHNGARCYCKLRGLRPCGWRECGQPVGDNRCAKVGSRLRCSHCGGKRINTWPAWHTARDQYGAGQ